jgi:hypothetical protein
MKDGLNYGPSSSQRLASFGFLLALSASLLNANSQSPLAAKPQVEPQPANPYAPSPIIRAVSFDVAHLQRAAPGSDLWPITWSDDGDLYTSWGDGGGFGGTDTDGRVAVGIARISGPGDRWTGLNILGGKNPVTADAPFPGKSNGILSIGGILYLHVIEQGKWWRAKIGRSSDQGQNWTFNEGPFDPKAWDFAEPDGAFSDMTFLNFGKDYRGARDDFVYVYSQDHRRHPDGSMAEITDNVALFRVSKDKILEHGAYEYFAGLNPDGPTWTHDIRKRAAVFSYPENVGFAVRVDYNPGLRRYLLTTFHRWDGSWGLYDAPEPWGPWTKASTFLQWIDSTPKFGFTFPQKWMSPDGKTMYMVFSGTGIYDSFNVVKATVTVR